MQLLRYTTTLYLNTFLFFKCQFTIKDVQGKLAKLYSIILLETKWMKQ